jgi:hypothetical protein
MSSFVSWISQILYSLYIPTLWLIQLAKMLKYLELQRLCDGAFVLFLISWPYTRHYLFMKMVYSAYVDLPHYFHRDNHDSPFYQVIPPKGGGQWAEGYNWNPQQGYYFTYEVHMAFIALLLTLQAILLLWFAMIIRLALRVLRGAHAEDDRSDDEDNNDTIDDDEKWDDDDPVHEDPLVSLDVVNGTTVNGNTPSSVNGIVSSSNGIAANGIHQRKMAG